MNRGLSDLRQTVSRYRALLAAGLAAGAVATALPVLAPTPLPGATVLAAARDLRPGTPLVAGDLVRLDLPRTAVPDGALVSTDAALGHLVTGPVRRGEPLTDVRLLGAGMLPSGRGLVASPVRLADPAEAALLHAGDRVDVLATASSGAAVAATVVAAAVSVLAVPTTSDGEGALVVLAASPAVAARLAAAAVASRLSVTVLPS